MVSQHMAPLLSRVGAVRLRWLEDGKPLPIHYDLTTPLFGKQYWRNCRWGGVEADADVWEPPLNAYFGCAASNLESAS
jgi:hypothetical protein